MTVVIEEVSTIIDGDKDEIKVIATLKADLDKISMRQSGAIKSKLPRCYGVGNCRYIWK